MEKIKVLVRIRPFLPNENSSKTGLNIDSQNSQKIEISKSLKRFEATFDKVLTQKGTQKDVFNFVKPCLNQIKQGINCTILAYGQTGSGKTYTMFGGEWAMNDKSNDYEQRKNFNKDKYNFIINEELMIDPFSKTNGIIPNLIMSLFQAYGSYDSNDNNIIITCSYIQIYNEQVYDLLVDEEENKEQKKKFDLLSNKINQDNEKPIKQKPLKIKHDRINGVTIEGVNEIRTPSFYDIFELLRQGEINRKIRQTKRNEMSSRSHTIFIINVQNEKLNVVSKIKLCDLAGSERYDSRESYKKIHFNEMVNINKSLLVLGNVIHSLGANNSNLSMTDIKNKKPKKIFAPYKDSKLTQILEDSLGGNSVTYLIANISPCEENFDETISTLKFADRAHSIMTTVSLNKLNNLDEGYKSKEFTKICDELFQLKQLLNIRKKRGTLEPIQEELLKLKDENTQLKKYLGGGNNVDRIKELMIENKNLRKEVKNLTEQNKNLKIEIQNKPLSHLSEDVYNYSDSKKSSYSTQKDKNKYSNNLLTTNNYNESKKKVNNKNSKNNNLNNGIEDSRNKNYLNTVGDDNLKTNGNNNKNRYDLDDMLNYNDINNNNGNNIISSKYSKPSKSNVFKESGQNIIYGNNNLSKKIMDTDSNISNTKKSKNLDNFENNDIYHDSNYNLDEDDDNDLTNKKPNPKIDKLKKATTPYERLELLNQLEMENKEETRKLLEDMEKNQNINLEDI